ncbi:MAG: HemK2/MTQ2 family protein methyltransferase [Candidatus Diapherotrites archaeon]
MKKFFFSDFEISVLDKVYEPKEDSELLAEVLGREDLQGNSALDMGTGSGIQSIILAKKGFDVTAVDVNARALDNVDINAEAFGFEEKIHVLKSDLFENVSGKFDVIIFNPPYVESETLKWKEVDGGKKGREVLDRFLQGVADFLNDTGVCYFLQSSLNGIEETEKVLKTQNFKFESIARKKLFFEELIVFKVSQHLR